MGVSRWGVLAVLLGLTILAQAQSGSIAGVVTDPSGAVVDGAKVTATNTATGLTRSIDTGQSGAYSIPNLPIGIYSVTMDKNGFAQLKIGNVNVTVAQVVPLNGQFQIGGVQESVVVSSEGVAPIETETSQISNLVDSQHMKALPLLTRNPYELVLLSPGTSQTNTSSAGITVNGARERNNNFLLDGVDNNDTSVPGFIGGILSADPESTQEFRVITNNFNAEYGRNTGAVVDVVTKSGTNNFHGDAYWFGRYNSFGGARDWFNRESDGRQNPYVRNQFGYSIGGPIIKNKTFFFFNNEFQRFRTTLTNSATVPTAAFKTGVFNFVDGSGNVVPVDLRQGSAQNPLGLPLDPTVQQILALYPNPTSLNPDGFTGQVFFPSSSQQDSYQTVLKIDHRLNSNHSLSLRYGYGHFFDPNPAHSDILPGGVGATDQKDITQGFAGNFTSTLTPSLVNNFNAGWNKLYLNGKCGGLDVLDSVSPLDQFGYGRDYIFNPFQTFGCTLLVADGQFRKTSTTSFADSLSWAHGAHTFKFGAEFRDVGESGPNNFFSRRQVDLRSVTIGGPGFSLIDVPGSTVALEDAASALYGFVISDLNAQFFDKSGARKGTDDKHFRQHEYGFFAQDSWKIQRNFTLNLGLRYQFNGVPFEEDANFSNIIGSPTAFPVVFSLVGPNTGHQLYNNTFNNIEPRIGFSWDPWSDGKTAVRGAFGIFHDRTFGNLFGNARGNPPFEQDYQNFPLETLNNAFGSGAFPAIAPQQIPSRVVPDGFGLAPIIFDNNFQNSSSNNWNFGVQRELPGNLVMDVNYVGAKGTHIFREVDGNPVDPTRVAELVAFCSDPANSFGCSPTDVTKLNLFAGADFGVLPFNAVEHNALIQPFYNRSVGNSIYHALQLKLTRRMSHGLEIQGAYTYSHSIDDSNDPLVPAAGNRGFPRNTLKLFEERGNSDNDLRHVAVINYIWDVPLGKGKTYLSKGFVGRVFEGMQLSGITTLQTGHPFDTFSNTDSERTGLSNRADVFGDPFAAGSNSNLTNGNKAFFTNPDVFAEPQYGRPGNVGRNHFYGPNFVNFDLSFAKHMSLTERVGLELRFEGYNIFNTPHFTNPGADANGLGNLLNSGIFGQITGTVTRVDGTTSARQMQVAMKLTF
jgi:hypothetical protein